MEILFKIYEVVFHKNDFQQILYKSTFLPLALFRGGRRYIGNSKMTTTAPTTIATHSKYRKPTIPLTLDAILEI